ncbi:hypothetical protein MLD38_017636 [Melastoma candidum]|uniref:Uncharacterized protein n=1 Tax=Melastoma candidum TaxID=119954 RepID=A0ACB9QVB5_9MYRT|nr:hypothetical protein MLD38_017636 [Melastoma candidum]
MSAATFCTKVTLIALLAVASINSMECHSFARTLLPEDKGLKTEKLTHIRFYFHDTITGANVTSIEVAEAPTTNSSKTSFGLVNVADEPMTEGPSLSSKLVGRAQGIFASASQEEVAFLMVFNYVFLEGEYNGSTLSVYGRNPIFNEVREMPVIGGTGVFRFARGYAQARTYFFNLTSNNAIVKYDVYVLHY